MLLVLTVLFIVVPILEIAVIIEVGSSIGVGPTILALILISVVGAWLTRHEGFIVLERMRAQIAQGRVPSDEIIDGFCVLGGGLLLLTPGFITDGVGLLLLFPLTRLPIRAMVRRRLRWRVIMPDPPGTGPASDDVIDI